ncbi:hypothetical protein [Burkholderia ubonensis]|uniref:hypothetical protein n=1 Tax=Burkholderia ubonensis TaxID=101571 RepID=UPI0012F8FBB7|nr:hypothetical protein [Burkholderia ubonensis]
MAESTGAKKKHGRTVEWQGGGRFGLSPETSGDAKRAGWTHADAFGSRPAQRVRDGQRIERRMGPAGPRATRNPAIIRGRDGHFREYGAAQAQIGDARLVRRECAGPLSKEDERCAQAACKRAEKKGRNAPRRPAAKRALAPP